MMYRPHSLIERLGDAFRGRLSMPHEVQGIDVSHWQGDIDWKKVIASDISFAIIRTSQGVNYEDRKFRRNWREAKRAREELGVDFPLGIYFFGSWYNAHESKPELDSRAEVEDAVRIAESEDPHIWDKPDLIPHIDVELAANAKKSKTDRWDKKPGDHMPYSAVVDWLGAGLERMDALTGRRTGIYTGRYFWIGDPKTGRRGLGRSTEFFDRPLWLAQYTGKDAPKYDVEIDGETWDVDIWQYTGSGSVPGISGKVDRNVSLGSVADFSALRGTDFGGLLANRPAIV